jgi:hypothetical protein
VQDPVITIINHIDAGATIHYNFARIPQGGRSGARIAGVEDVILTIDPVGGRASPTVVQDPVIRCISDVYSRTPIGGYSSWAGKAGLAETTVVNGIGDKAATLTVDPVGGSTASRIM